MVPPMYFFLELSFADIFPVIIGQDCCSVNMSRMVEVKGGIDKPQNALSPRSPGCTLAGGDICSMIEEHLMAESPGIRLLC